MGEYDLPHSSQTSSPGPPDIRSEVVDEERGATAHCLRWSTGSLSHLTDEYAHTSRQLAALSYDNGAGGLAPHQAARHGGITEEVKGRESRNHREKDRSGGEERRGE